MGQTTGGLPWPEDSDAVAAGAQAIRALAEAVDSRPYYFADRVTSMSIPAAGGADCVLGAGAFLWNRIESNFTPGDAGGGFAVPRAGLWVVRAATTLNAVWPGGAGTQWGCGVVGSSGNEIGQQYNEQTSSSGTVRRSIEAVGAMRLALGDVIRMVMWQNLGSAQNTGVGGSVGPPYVANRWAVRFSAEWKAP